MQPALQPFCARAMLKSVRAVERIRTDRLLLRPLQSEDQEALDRLWSDPEVRRFLWDDRPLSRDRVVQEIQVSQRNFETLGLGQFAVLPQESPELLIGFTGLRPFGEPPAIELLYALDPAWWGHGLATEASAAVLRFGFEELGLDEIYAGADPPNEPSFQVMDRLGLSFAYETTINGLPTRYHRLRRGDFKLHPGRYELLHASA
jgi:RimJ/RimL family protein N-acetyltransferase